MSLSGKREAELSALGVVSGVHRPDGIVGDLGGGSLELIDVHGSRIRPRHDAAARRAGAAGHLRRSRSRRPRRSSRDALADVTLLEAGEGRTFYAVGGTWRALARLHMWQTGYPLHVMHGYVIRAKEALEFSRLVHRVDPETLSQIEVVYAMRAGRCWPMRRWCWSTSCARRSRATSCSRRSACARACSIRCSTPRSAARIRCSPPPSELNLLRSRSPQHGEELIAWTDRFMASSGLDETAEEKRLRHAACLLADIGWRAHPDYRGEQSLNIIAHAAFVGIDHPGRAYLALAVFFRHVGLVDEELSPRLRELASTRMLDRARVLGAALRVAYLVSAAKPGVLPRTPLKVERHRLMLRMKGDTAALAGERVASRLKQLARLIGREPVMVTE